MGTAAALAMTAFISAFIITGVKFHKGVPGWFYRVYVVVFSAKNFISYPIVTPIYGNVPNSLPHSYWHFCTSALKRPDTFRSVPRFSTHFEQFDPPQISPVPVIPASEFRNLEKSAQNLSVASQ